jgi:hypothetical protein
MEKLKKLSDFKRSELKSSQLALLKGSEEVCTGGGFRHYWISDGSGGQCTRRTMTWTSDVDTYVGGRMVHESLMGVSYESGSC